MADKIQKLTLLTQVDERTIRRSIDLTRQLTKEQESLADMNAQATKATETFSGGLRASEIRLRNRIALFRQERKAILDSAAAIRTRNAEEASQVHRRISAISGVERGIGGVASLVPGAGGDALRGVGNVVGLGADLPKISAGIAEMGLSVGAVGAASLIAAPAVIGVALAVKEFTKQLEGGKAALTDAIAAQTEYYRLIFGPTTSGEIRASITAVETNLAALRATRADVEAQRESSTQGGNEQGGLSAIAATVAYLALNKQLEENKAAIESSERELYGLNRALESAEVATRDAAIRQEELAQLTTTRIMGVLQARINAENLGATASMEAVNQRLAAIERQKTAIREMLVGMDSASAASIQLTARFAELAREEQALEAITIPLVRANEREAEAKANREGVIAAQSQFNESMLELEKKLGEERTRIAQATTTRIIEIETRLAEQEKSAIEDAARSNVQARQSLRDDMDAVNQAAQDREIEARIESASKIEDLLRHHEAEVRRIKADGARDERDALLNRDAVALDKAQRTREEGLSEADSQLEEALAQEKKSLKEQLEAGKRADAQRIRDLKTAFDQERRDRATALAQKLADLRRAAEQEIAQTRQQGQQQLSQLEAQYAAERAKLTTHFAEQLRKYGVFFRNLETTTANELNLLADDWTTFFNRMTVTPGGAPTTTTTTPNPPRNPNTPTRLAYGSRDYAGGFTKVGDAGQESIYAPRGSDIYSNRETRNILRAMASGKTGGSIGSVSVTINTQSTDAKGIMREVSRQFPKLMADTLEKLQSGN